MTSVEVVIPEQTNKLSFKTDVSRWADEISKVAYKGFTAERIIAGAMQAGVKDEKIFDCDPASLFLALTKAARLGLDIGDSGIYLVPLNQKVKRRGVEKQMLVAEAWVDYRGLKLLAMRAGIVSRMDEYVIYDGDEWEVEYGLEPTLMHRPRKLAAQRGDIVAAYTVIQRRKALPTFHLMEIGEIEKRREKSRSWGPKYHPKCPPWYAAKTTVRDYLSRQPKTPEMIEALTMDDTEEIVQEVEVPTLAPGESLDPLTGVISTEDDGA